MSCNYADGLSPYEDKGVLGIAEKFDAPEKICEKSKLLAEWISKSKHVVIHTGAGISTSAGIPDFRGPNGVWTLEKQGVKPNINISFNDALPTRTHMALKTLVENDYVKFIISQNIDGLHLRSGISRQYVAELHGNMFTEQCATCKRQYIRQYATTSVGQKFLGKTCPAGLLARRGCRGKIQDTILDWEASLPDDDLLMADYHSSVADLSIALGTTLQIVPSGNLPTFTKKYGGRLAIVNLQPTKHDKKADLMINGYVDDVISKIMKHLGLEIPEYVLHLDPTKVESPDILQWSFSRSDINEMKDMYKAHMEIFKKLKLQKKRENEIEVKTEVKTEFKKVKDEKFNPLEGDEFVKKKRTFRKFTYRGVDLDQLLDMPNEQLMELMHARARRRFSRGLKRKPMALVKKLRKAKKEAPPNEKPEIVKTHLRNMIIVPEMVGSIVGVYNGKAFNQVEIKPEMIGHYLGEFSLTYKPVKHGRPGIGATHSSRFIPLK
ncbi:hypothetical protein FQA39_LY02456 [Lamprigera yunnana]|nr:hypothetical protein FQA39_LY02456 [Lamprigera yunnana]